MPLGNHRYGFESTLLMMRIVGWLESLAALEVLAFSVNHWSDVIDVVAAGIISVCVALLSDSWEIVALSDKRRRTPRLHPPKLLMIDIFSLVLSLGGVVLINMAKMRKDWGSALILGGEDENNEDSVGSSSMPPGNDSFEKFSDYGWTKEGLLKVGMYLLVGHILWRFALAVTAGMDATQRLRYRAAGGQQRTGEVEPVRPELDRIDSRAS